MHCASAARQAAGRPALRAAADLRCSAVPSLHKMPQVILLRSALVFHAAARSAGLPAA